MNALVNKLQELGLNTVENINRIKDTWLKSKSGFLNEEDLVFDHFKYNGNWYCYKCPCGGLDHVAYRVRINEGYSSYLSEVLNCFYTNQQWVVCPVSIEKVIENEEINYFKLIEKAPTIVRKVTKEKGLSEDTFKYLKDTYGIDKELAEMVLN